MYLTIEELLDRIDEPNRTRCKKILEDCRFLFLMVQGSSHNHQAWTGGYLDHVVETMNIAVAMFMMLNDIRVFPFTLSDALLVLFLHDVEKPWKYEIAEDESLRIKEELRSKDAQHRFRMRKLEEYGIILTEDQQNGLEFVEGELVGYSSTHRAMGPLAGFCHACDVFSARVWFDHPMEKNDPWIGACRQGMNRKT